VERLPANKIKVDNGIQSREEVNTKIVADYAEEIKNGEVFPPVVVFYDGLDYWLADGFHRIYAYKLCGVEEVSCDVREGSRDDAIKHSAGSNSKHGLKRTNADKRKSVLMIFNLPENQDKLKLDPPIEPSLTDIAEICGVNRQFASNILTPLLSCYGSMMHEVTRNGKKYLQKKKHKGKSTSKKTTVNSTDGYTSNPNAGESTPPNTDTSPDYATVSGATVWTPIVEIYDADTQTEPEKNYNQFLALIDKLEPILALENVRSFSIVDRTFFKQRLLQIQNRINDILNELERGV